MARCRATRGQRGAWAASVRHTRAYHHAWTLHYRTLSAFILSFLVILHNACMSKSKSSHGLSLPHVSFARRNARTAEFSRDEASSFFRLASAFPHRPVALHYATQSTSMTTVSDSNFQPLRRFYIPYASSAMLLENFLPDPEPTES